MAKKPAERIAEQFGTNMKAARSAYEGREGRRLPGGRLSQERLAELVGGALGETVAQNTAGTWFRGTIPPPATVMALAKVLRVPAGWLLFNEGSTQSDELLSRYKG